MIGLDNKVFNDGKMVFVKDVWGKMLLFKESLSDKIKLSCCSLDLFSLSEREDYFSDFKIFKDKACCKYKLSNDVEVVVSVDLLFLSDSLLWVVPEVGTVLYPNLEVIEKEDVGVLDTVNFKLSFFNNFKMDGFFVKSL